jgi:hypothetical protein
MDPPESLFQPEIVLSMASSFTEKHKDLMDKLNPGSMVEFEAELIEMGNEEVMHHLHGRNLKIIEDSSKDVSNIIIKEASIPISLN